LARNRRSGGNQMMNLLDKKIERMAYEILSEQNLPISLIEFKIRELQILIDRRINSRSEIIGLLKLAKGAK
jgi:hypothetical protein